MTIPSLRLPLLAASFAALVLAGCGARTVLRDTVDGGAVAPDSTPGVDVPITPFDVPITPVDVPITPPIDVPVTPVDVPVTPVDGPIEVTSCERAIPVSNGTVLTGQDTTGLGGVAATCPLVTVPGAGPRWYRATVEPGETFLVSAESEVGVRAPLVRAFTGCTNRFCAGGSNTAFDGRTVTFAFTNAGPRPQDLFIAVSGIAPGIAARYTLRTSVTRAPDNATCASARRVVDGTTLRGEDLTTAHTPAAWCNGGSSANALFYAVRVGPGEVLTARASGSAGSFPTPTLRLGVGCATTNCLASSTTTGTTGTALSYTNTTDLAQELLLAADAGSAGAPAFRYDLAISVARPPYTVSRTSIECDPMTAATVIPGAVGDDVGTPAIPLPIRFPYFGAPMLAWSVSTNGYLQVWPTPMGSSVGALGISALPFAGGPSNMIAPFWDDLEVRSAEAMDVRWQLFATPAPHLTVQWNLGFCCGGTPTDRVTFQAKLFERTGVVEFHYCDQRGGERSRGQLASIGLQDESGSRGVSAQLRMSTIDPMTAFRLTPTP